MATVDATVAVVTRASMTSKAHMAVFVYVAAKTSFCVAAIDKRNALCRKMF
jgi:hypothetical protein